jgi:diaminohydroxyphosphoribosylaminopyrimidine deaminase/5-amino-6-(5-phosphoribosylamino)uracil reductase
VIQPLKVVLDSHLRISPSSKIFQGGRNTVLVAVTKAASLKKIKSFEKKARIIIVKSNNGRVDLKTLLRALGENGIVRVLIEGGGELIADAFEKKLVQEVFAFVAPVIIGGREAVTSVGGNGAGSLKQAIRFSSFDVQCLGSDVLLHGVL